MNHRPDNVARLQAKLDAVMSEPLAIPDITVPQNLPYLNTFIKEGIRVHGAVPTLQKRVVSSPASNSSASHESFEISWATHRRRHPGLVHAPATPLCSSRRSLTGGFPQSRTNSEMQAHFIPFGMRSRIWGSLALAMMKMRPTRQER
ncbi:hypothetical protein FIBSPDRAFT_188186 [Athelia psychrophila]|uniref:Cytochrome P450 n=1 Tax=Athelia psychrophila TaxID=1759441 RepID=A0A166A968_9AGAM|nr:hypothetical protein FIBSPDRAFT_188186 [Fibularhizoctonia sp. CBS 109695]